MVILSYFMFIFNNEWIKTLNMVIQFFELLHDFRVRCTTVCKAKHIFYRKIPN